MYTAFWHCLFLLISINSAFIFWFSVNSKVCKYSKPDILCRRLASLAWCTRRWRRRWGRCRSSPSNQGRRTTNGSVKKFNFMVKNKAKIFFLKYSEQIVFQKNIDLGKSCKTKFLFTVRIIFGLIKSMYNNQVPPAS